MEPPPPDGGRSTGGFEPDVPSPKLDVWLVGRAFLSSRCVLAKGSTLCDVAASLNAACGSIRRFICASRCVGAKESTPRVLLSSASSPNSRPIVAAAEIPSLDASRPTPFKAPFIRNFPVSAATTPTPAISSACSTEGSTVP